MEQQIPIKNLNSNTNKHFECVISVGLLSFTSLKTLPGLTNAKTKKIKPQAFMNS